MALRGSDYVYQEDVPAWMPAFVGRWLRGYFTTVYLVTATVSALAGLLVL